MKLKIKLLLATFLIVCLTTLIYFSFFYHANDPKLATVLSTEPIKSSRLIEHENCSVTGILGSFSQESLSRYHPAQRECRTILIIQSLQSKTLPLRMENQQKTCVITNSIEQVIVSYDVVYQIGNSVGKVRMPYKPNMFIPLNEDGRLDLSMASRAVCESVRSGSKDLMPFYCLHPDELPLSTQQNDVLEVQKSQNTFGIFQ
ncbi:Uncharacterised protein [Providencia rustigianii]|uniref:Uncharacterized protein n=2 Tax=Providencia rustigianii TaxID=158850 RepID=D1P588_9GAMM|nr:MULTISPECIES: UmoD family flagellar biogenesis regulator [Providencia]EFB71449.1 hypothetical protein PROVRUST_07393 [Providencia rustigianii DSM 4541]MTC57739.1 hypothetical protein [Providencia rustigianii]SPY77836.1 Uncharacterised protein [Providencia rustigianii]SUC27362.1 Uncharacterised protein [Providencia rustigianii]SUC35881.1 Uncharacterised protein [Providencia rustigianii]